MEDLNKHILKNAIQDLPEYSPSSEILVNIMASLSGSVDTEPMKSVWPSPRTILISALALVAISGGLYWFLSRSRTVVRTEEVVAESVIGISTEMDIEKEKEAIQYIRQNAYAEGSNQAQELSLLQASLDELEKARVTLVERLTPYSQDPVIVSQLAEIERKKSEIIVKMLKFV